jgi:2-phosphoglycolate phosphatase
MTVTNADQAELAKFSALAHRWWDPHSEFRPLHDINPLRLDYIDRMAGGLAEKRVVDIGCGGGILAEAMAGRGAQVTGIDLSEKALKVAQLHALESGAAVDYRLQSAEQLAATAPAGFDIVTCMEMLEHVPDPAQIVAACATLLQPGGLAGWKPIRTSTTSSVHASRPRHDGLQASAPRAESMSAVPRLAVKGVLFDLDGTLIDSAPDLGAAVNRMRLQRNLPLLADAQLRPYASHGARGLLQAGFDMSPDHPEYRSMRDEFLASYEAALCVNTVIFAGVPELLDALDAVGLSWGIVTNKASRFTLPLLDALGLRSRSACIVCGDTAARAKPFPDPLFVAAEMLALPPSACVYVGDAERDIQAGIAAGMPTLVARYGYIQEHERPEQWQASGHLDSPLQLLSWLPERSPS